MRYLIVNADDLGASRGVNRGVLEASRHGIVTSASLMVDGVAAEDAVRRVLGETTMSLGLHLDLPARTGEAGIDYDDPDAVRAAIRSQLDRFVELAGTGPTHIDTHHNVHRVACVRPVLVETAEEVGVPLRESGAARYIPDFYGQWDGETHPEAVSVAGLVELLRRPDPSVLCELGCHPGYVDADHATSYSVERRLELETLCDPDLRDALSDLGIELVSFHEYAAIVDDLGLEESTLR